MAKQNIGINIEHEETKTHHIFKVAKIKEGEEPYGRSKSEKTITVCSTKGNQKIGDYVFGINGYTYPEEK